MGNFSCFVLSPDFFSKLTFSIRNTIRLSYGLVLLVPILVQTVCKGYQQTTQVAACKQRVHQKILEILCIIIDLVMHKQEFKKYTRPNSR